MRAAPRAFLHGNPHVDNFAFLDKGAAMVDFDRSRVGPYTWDLVRIWAGLGLKSQGSPGQGVPEEALEVFDHHYLEGYRHPEREFLQKQSGISVVVELLVPIRTFQNHFYQ